MSIELGHAALIGDALEQSEHAVFLSSEGDGRYLAVNGAACRLTGYERAELLTLTSRDLSARSQEDVDAVYERLRERRFLRGAARIRRADRAVVEIAYWGSRTRLRDGDVLLTVTDAIETARLVARAARARERARAVVEDAGATHAQARQQVRRSEAARRSAAEGRLERRDEALLRDALHQRRFDCWARFDDAAAELALLHEVPVDELLFAVRRAALGDDG